MLDWTAYFLGVDWMHGLLQGLSLATLLFVVKRACDILHTARTALAAIGRHLATLEKIGDALPALMDALESRKRESNVKLIEHSTAVD